MKKLLAGLLSCIFVLSGCVYYIQPAKQEPIKTENHNNLNYLYKSSIKVYLKAKVGDQNPSGSAFAFSDRYLLTAAHVCVAMEELRTMEEDFENDIRYEYYGPDGETILTGTGLEVYEVDTVHDICVLKKENHGLVPLQFADPDSVKAHQKIFIVGAPMGFFQTIFSGEVLMPKMNLSAMAKNKIVFSCVAYPGNSGSAVVNEDGKVIGILIAGITPTQITFGTGIWDILYFLKIVEQDLSLRVEK